jgi:hypothetical protein
MSIAEFAISEAAIDTQFANKKQAPAKRRIVAKADAVERPEAR